MQVTVDRPRHLHFRASPISSARVRSLGSQRFWRLLVLMKPMRLATGLSSLDQKIILIYFVLIAGFLQGKNNRVHLGFYNNDHTISLVPMQQLQ